MIRSVGAVLLAAALTACTTEAEPAPRPAPKDPAASAAEASTPASQEPEEPRLVVVGHATLPQLRLSERAAARLTAGETARWRGFRVLSDRPAGRAIRAVQRDPRTLAVVPVDAVGPTVVAARIGGVDPVRDDRRATTVTVAGDIMLTRRVQDPVAALAPMRARLRRSDLTVGNLESTLSTRGEPTQDDSFGGSADLLGPLTRAGFDALSLANNHVGDYGVVALLDTVRELRRSPIVPFGAGRDDVAAARPAVLRANGATFAFLGFNAIGETPRAEPGQPGALSVRMPPRTGPLVRADLSRVTRTVRRAGRVADVVVVLPHWGTQYTHTPDPVQRSVARALVRAGADLVVGGHPHWVQGVDAVGDVPVVHSLGNFVFDMDFMEQTMEGVLLEATFWGAHLKAIRFVPYRLDPVTFASQVVDDPAILDDLWSASTGPFQA